MTSTDDWRRAMHQRDQRYRTLRMLVRGLILVVALLSAGIIGITAELAPVWGWITGGLGLVGAALLWWEVEQ